METRDKEARLKCPLLMVGLLAQPVENMTQIYNEECIRVDCAWWHEDDDFSHTEGCAVWKIVECMINQKSAKRS